MFTKYLILNNKTGHKWLATAEEALLYKTRLFDIGDSYKHGKDYTVFGDHQHESPLTAIELFRICCWERQQQKKRQNMFKEFKRINGTLSLKKDEDNV